MPERIALDVNGRTRHVEVEPDTPLLLVLRNDLGLTAAKFGCGLEQCGACKVIVDGEAVFSCREPVVAFAGRRITTLEGIGTAQNTASVAARVHRGAGRAVRLLHTGHHRRRKSPARSQPRSDRRGDSQRAGGPSLSLRLARANHQSREESGAGRGTMSELSPSLQRNPDLDSWVRIDDGGTVTLFTGKVELGQGVRTAIARIGAEELDVSLARIRVQTADTAHGPNELLTVGSGSMEESGRAMRQAAAEARRHLLELAAEHLGVGSDQLEVDDGTVSAPGLDRRTTYWELFGGKRFGRAVTGDVEPKQPADYRIVGKAAERIDLAAIVTGTARFVQDLTRPGMLYGRVVRPPSPAARLESIDETRARDLPGVVAVVRDGSFLGAVAEREEQAVKAADTLRAGARWSEQETLPAMDQLHEWLLAQPVSSYRVVEGVPVEGAIDPIAAPAGAARTLEATYTPAVPHARVDRPFGGARPVVGR